MEAAETQNTNCAFFVVRKRRFCKMAPITGEAFCCQHLPVNTLSNGRSRVSCPLDSKHSCYEDELEKHLKKCNARERLQPVYYEKNANSGTDDAETQVKIPLSEVRDETLLKLLDKLEKAYNAHVSPLTESLETTMMTTELTDSSYGPYVLKHLKQNASLLEILKGNNLLQDGNCFVEFGAGRGQLSHWIIQTLNTTQNSSFVLVERGSQRHKFDNKHKSEDGLSICRLKIDIEHLNLDKVSLISSNKPIVAVGKHLCGTATDLALKCLINYETSTSSRDAFQKRVKGICIAMCCHHQCNWKNYTGKYHLTSWGFDVKDFHILQSVSSWATCGTRYYPAPDGMDIPQENQRYKSLNLPTHKREFYGTMSKLLLEEGRARFLQQHGFKTQLIRYVEKTVSLENVALLATH